MSVLFEPYEIGSLEIRNRFMRSPTTSYWSDERGVVRPEIIDLYRRLAEGGVGLIVKGHTYVADAGKAHKGMAGISGAVHVHKLRELTDVVHIHGGKIVAQGILGKVLKNPRSLTASYLTRELEITIPEERRKFTERKSIEVKGAREFNLKDIDVRIPLGGIICVTGVSGSGKSTLVREILYKGLSRSIYRSHEKPGAHEKITGSNWIDKVVEIVRQAIEKAA